ncbi:hypothetical protein Pan216_47430 [Planctomycetes bacterium Pan216]|uniref:HEAT repeat protein n=1 Tax=Kolteria novifilia TaxID=2527975 RepID=A0A518BA51_9BACT|nr:hypothetical protein Pan216_47430 [Planctomycetes bacterium Pan216]
MALEALAEGLHLGDWQLRLVVVEDLAEFAKSNPKAVEALEEALPDPRPDVDRAIRDALKEAASHQVPYMIKETKPPRATKEPGDE